jgi:hypothetical protein
MPAQDNRGTESASAGCRGFAAKQRLDFGQQRPAGAGASVARREVPSARAFPFESLAL